MADRRRQIVQREQSAERRRLLVLCPLACLLGVLLGVLTHTIGFWWTLALALPLEAVFVIGGLSWVFRPWRGGYDG